MTSSGGRRTIRGFDAVVGNPPYGANLDKSDKRFVKISLPAVDNVADSFVVFTERGLLELAHQGRMGLIVPSGLADCEKCTVTYVSGYIQCVQLNI